MAKSSITEKSKIHNPGPFTCPHCGQTGLVASRCPRCRQLVIPDIVAPPPPAPPPPSPSILCECGRPATHFFQVRVFSPRYFSKDSISLCFRGVAGAVYLCPRCYQLELQLRRATGKIGAEGDIIPINRNGGAQ
jgi:hypothetical protein